MIATEKVKTVSVINHTPFPAIAFRQYNLLGELNGVVSVCGTFKLMKNEPLKVADIQQPLVLTDTYEGDPHKTIMVRQGALTPFKPSTDITMIGNTYSPTGQLEKTWLCGLKVGQNQKLLRVYGHRVWQPHYSNGRLANWFLSDATPVQSIPLDWLHAYGGTLPHEKDDKQPDVCRYNPLGCGIVDLEHFDPRVPVAAPQIEDPNDPIKQWDKEYIPQGFGLISPWWRQRQQYAGTYDDNWKNVRHPLLPLDFDYRFYQSAPQEFVSSSYLKGDEKIELVNLTPPTEHLISQLPNIQLAMRIMRDGQYAYGKLELDSVHFDMRPSVKRVFLSWRIGFPWADGKGLPELSIIDNKED